MILRGRLDAFGWLLMGQLRGEGRGVAFERDDGHIGVAFDAGHYFTGFRRWPAPERRALGLARGRVLDVGCGAGRHCLHLQRRGFDVTGIDNSELAVRVCRERGVRRVIAAALTDFLRMPLRRLGGRFDTVLMMDNNLGLLGRFRQARSRLERLRRLTGPGAVIVGSTLDPYASAPPEHTAYHRFNRGRGRLGGEVRIRVLCGGCRTPWFDYTLWSRPELRRVLAGTGWRLDRTLDGPGSQYVAVIRRAAGS